MNPTQLANKIKEIMSNEELYNNYLTFKTQSISNRFNDIILQSYIHPNLMCRLCSLGHLARNEYNNTIHE